MNGALYNCAAIISPFNNVPRLAIYVAFKIVFVFYRGTTVFERCPMCLVKLIKTRAESSMPWRNANIVAFSCYVR